MQRLQDRVAVITGAGSGIGLATARRLAAEGALVVAVDIDEESGKAAAEQARGEFIAADVASEQDVRRLYESVVAQHGRVDIAFHNAGISPPDDDSILHALLHGSAYSCVEMKTFLVSLNASGASGPSSRPRPDCLNPPNGVQYRTDECELSLIHI